VTADFDHGLTDYVDDSSVGIENIIYQSGIDRVSIIPAGSNHERAVELFSSSEMNTLLYELKNRYPDRNIIVNTPPVLKTSEARVLTEYCDLTVLTVPFGKASSADVEDAVNAIGSEHIAGVIYQQ
jgi:Mrp family chromosome partitioning ATPase